MLLGAGLSCAWPHDRTLPDFPVGPVDEQRMQRTADAMLQFGSLPGSTPPKSGRAP
jgi:hypothetical protein